MNRLYAAVAVLLVILGLFWGYTYQTGKAAKASVKAEIATQAVSEAVAQSKADLKADAQVQAKKAAALDSVRPLYAIVREKNVEAEKPAAGASIDPWVSVFNDAVRASNATIESTGNLSGTM